MSPSSQVPEIVTKPKADCNVIAVAGDASSSVCSVPRNPSWQPPTVPGWVLGVNASLVLLTGGAPCETCGPIYYEQPYWQTFLMFVAESCCLLIYGADQFQKKIKGGRLGLLEFPQHSWSLERASVPWWWFAFPSLMDLMGTSLINFAFAMTYASTVQMLRNSLILFTAGMSMISMKRALRVYEWLGILIMTIGMFLAGLDTIFRPEPASNLDESDAWLGIVCTLLGTILNAGVIVTEEWMLKRRYCPPFRAVGWCGVTGLGWNIVALVVVHYCGIEDLRANFYMIGQSHGLMMSQFMYCLAALIFNGSGMIVTKVGTGLLKGSLYACRAPLMWVFELFMGWQIFTIMNLMGFILTFSGFFVFTGSLGKQESPTRRATIWYNKEVPFLCTVPQGSQRT